MSQDTLEEILQQRQLLPSEDLKSHCLQARQGNRFLEEQLIEAGVLTSEEILRILENHHFCPAVSLAQTPYDPASLACLPKSLAVRHLVLPLKVLENSLQVACWRPEDRHLLDSVAAVSGHKIMPVVALRHEIRDAVDRLYRQLEQETQRDEKGNGGARDTTGTRPATSAGRRGLHLELDLEDKEPSAIVAWLLDAAIINEVADIHMEPRAETLTVRFRLDGILYTVARLPKEKASAISSHAKILGGMDIAEKRLPQDGRYTVKRSGMNVDVRISSLPSQFGEKIVMRLLSKPADLLNLENLHMPPGVRKPFAEVITAPVGLFLVTGPTGSGKTTTLYAALNSLDRESLNVVTLEDPIEYSLDKAVQVNIHEEIGLTFASGLRSILRQDPDVVLVGEIRDLETVEIACRAALTGHKVLSTLHTNDAAQAIERLVDMGVPPYLIAATLRGIVAQRLIRLVCPGCREEYPPNESERALLGYPDVEHIYHGPGCRECRGTGYRGRMAVFEYLRVSDSIHRLIMERASSYAIRHSARQAGMVPMAEYAKRLVLEGRTTVAEIQRAILFDEGQEQLCQGCQRIVSIDFTICPFCQHVLKERCHGCGASVEATWEVCASCGTRLEREWEKSYCPHCMAPVSAHWESCHFCGGTLG